MCLWVHLWLHWPNIWQDGGSSFSVIRSRPLLLYYLVSLQRHLACRFARRLWTQLGSQCCHTCMLRRVLFLYFYDDCRLCDLFHCVSWKYVVGGNCSFPPDVLHDKILVLKLWLLNHVSLYVFYLFALSMNRRIAVSVIHAWIQSLRFVCHGFVSTLKIYVHKEYRMVISSSTMMTTTIKRQKEKTWLSMSASSACSYRSSSGAFLPTTHHLMIYVLIRRHISAGVIFVWDGNVRFWAIWRLLSVCAKLMFVWKWGRYLYEI